MRKLFVNIAALAAIIAGFWIADMVGDPELGASTANLGSIIAVVLGFFAAAGIGLTWGGLAERLDLKDQLRRMRGKNKSR